MSAPAVAGTPVLVEGLTASAANGVVAAVLAPSSAAGSGLQAVKAQKAAVSPNAAPSKPSPQQPVSREQRPAAARVLPVKPTGPTSSGSAPTAKPTAPPAAPPAASPPPAPPAAPVGRRAASVAPAAAAKQPGTALPNRTDSGATASASGQNREEQWAVTHLPVPPGAAWGRMVRETPRPKHSFLSAAAAVAASSPTTPPSTEPQALQLASSSPVALSSPDASPPTSIAKIAVTCSEYVYSIEVFEASTYPCPP